jgi:hypothetical protein
VPSLKSKKALPLISPNSSHTPGRTVIGGSVNGKTFIAPGTVRPHSSYATTSAGSKESSAVKQDMSIRLQVRKEAYAAMKMGREQRERERNGGIMLGEGSTESSFGTSPKMFGNLRRHTMDDQAMKVHGSHDRLPHPLVNHHMQKKQRPGEGDSSLVSHLHSGQTSQNVHPALMSSLDAFVYC